MPSVDPENISKIQSVIELRLSAITSQQGIQETVTIEWRGAQINIPVISMPVDMLYYNPRTHRVRAQRSMDPALERELDDNPFGAPAQGYLYKLLQGDPSDPSKIDPSFIALRDDLKDHGQSEPGIITRTGILINGNTRRAALKDIGLENIRVGVLPTDAGLDDLQSIELALQLRKDHKRDYSFMNFLLALDERVKSGQQPAAIQSDFRIKATTYEMDRWILAFIRDAIKRSTTLDPNNIPRSLRLLDFETHQGKLEELYRAYTTLRKKSPDSAESLREQRLIALILEKSKTDLRLIEHDFFNRYMKTKLPDVGSATPPRIPGTTIVVNGPSSSVLSLQALTTKILQAEAIRKNFEVSSPDQVADANAVIASIAKDLEEGLGKAGKTARLVKTRLAAVDRIDDACDSIDLAIEAIAQARSGGTFNQDDFDEPLSSLRGRLVKLGYHLIRGAPVQSDGLKWINAVANLETDSD